MKFYEAREERSAGLGVECDLQCLCAGQHLEELRCESLDQVRPVLILPHLRWHFSMCL